MDKTFPIHPWSELQELPKREYMIKGLLDRHALSVVYGQSNSGKTFFVLDVAAHISCGMSWQGRRTIKGQVLYIAAEGGLGVCERLEAFRKHNNLQGYGALYVLPAGISLCGEEHDTDALIEQIKGLGQFELIIVDTLSRAMAGGDENSPKDMSAFVKNCDALKEETGAHVLIIHHSGKDQSKGARGHSALRAAVDTEIEITNKSGVVSAEIVKQRDGATNEAFHFELKQIYLGEDEDGDKITSCVLEATEVLAIKGQQLKDSALKTYRVLCDLMLESSIEHIPRKGMHPQECIKLEEFKDHFFKAGIADTDKTDSVAKAFLRCKNKLKDLGYISEWDGYIWLLDRPDI